MTNPLHSFSLPALRFRIWLLRVWSQSILRCCTVLFAVRSVVEEARCLRALNRCARRVSTKERSRGGGEHIPQHHNSLLSGRDQGRKGSDPWNVEIRRVQRSSGVSMGWWSWEFMCIGEVGRAEKLGVKHSPFVPHSSQYVNVMYYLLYSHHGVWKYIDPML